MILELVTATLVLIQTILLWKLLEYIRNWRYNSHAEQEIKPVFSIFKKKTYADFVEPVSFQEKYKQSHNIDQILK